MGPGKTRAAPVTEVLDQQMREIDDLCLNSGHQQIITDTQKMNTWHDAEVARFCQDQIFYLLSILSPLCPHSLMDRQLSRLSHICPLS